MSGVSDVSVKLDERVRLLSAVLAATRYPDDEQARHPHGTHSHARATRRRLADFSDHAAARALQRLIDQGVPLEAIFTLALRNEGKPQGWDDALYDFYAAAELFQWWQDEDAAWGQALDGAQRTFAGVGFKPFLQPFLGSVSEQLVFIPNILYPTDRELGLRAGGELVCIAPPRVAWGDSPPWPYDEDPAHVYRAALGQYAYILMDAFLRAHAEIVVEVAQQTPLPVSDEYRAFYPTWAEQFTHLFVAGVVAIYLEDHLSTAEASAYVLMERKVRGLEVLPGVINVLRRYLSAIQSGRYKSMIDLLPQFSKQLRVANRIVSL